MENQSESVEKPKGALIAIGLFLAVMTGAAFAGWFNHGGAIFLTMASDAWALCF